MTFARFHVTYDIVTEDSARDGGTAESGYIMGGNMHVTAGTPEDRAACAMTLREALSHVGYLEDGDRWFSEIDSRIDYATGDIETRALHPPHNITRASYGRLVRLLKGKHWL